ncbi:uncharacterized protein [Cardiocondyla obscurior]|uniref:uncharacterized protein n=1 Tax=Cardiocondyla obscurior TaxID=286306 RepID=UPI00396584F4
MKKMVDDEEAYKAFHTFAGRVMSAKEDAERQRRGQPVNSTPGVGQTSSQGNHAPTGVHRARRVGGVVEEYASAQDYDKPGPASFKQKKARPKGHSPYPSPLVNRRPSRASSPTPSMASNTTADVYTDDVFISGTEDSDVSGSFGSGKRKRGRPATTGDYVGLAAAKRQVLETEQEIAEMEERKAILDPLSSLNPKLRESVDDAVEHYLEEFKNAPSGDIVSQTYEDVDQILRVSGVSKGLKGTLAKALKKAACRARAGITVLSTRNASTSGGNSNAELQLLKELDQARKEIKNLREEVRALRCRAAELPIIRPACTSPNATEKRLRTPPPMDEPMEEDNPSLTNNTTIGAIPSTSMPPAIRPPIKGRSKVLRDTSPSEFEAEELLLKRLDGLFGKWCERRFGTSPPFPIAKEKPPASTTQKKQKPTAGSTKKAAESSTKERRKKKTGATSGQESQSEISMPPPSSRKNTRDIPKDPPSRSTSARTEVWAKVVGRKAKKKTETTQVSVQRSLSKNNNAQKVSAKKRPSEIRDKGQTQPTAPKKRNKKRKVPNTAAITITCPKGKYEDTLKLAKSQIDLASLGINELKSRRGLTGSIIYEISGEDNTVKADALSEAMSKVLANCEGVKITRPRKMADIRVRDLDDSITSNEVAEAVIKLTKCAPEDIKTGPPRRSFNELFTILVHCPLSVANKIVASKRIRIGWISARVELLAERPLQCFRCLQSGHVRERCPSTEDRSNCCFRCGVPGHRAVECVNPPSCPACKKAGRPHGHKMGGAACSAQAKPARNNGTNRGKGTSENVVVTETIDPPPKPQRPATRRTAVNKSAEKSSDLEETNLNHAREAQDLFVHSLVEYGCGVGIAAEPYRVPPNHPSWAVDTLGSVAIHWTSHTRPCIFVASGDGWVCVEWNTIYLIGIYISPALNLVDFETRLMSLDGVIRQLLPRPILVAGDFNAKSLAWGCPRPDRRGDITTEWADSLSLSLINEGNVPTCIAWRGESIVDLTWASPSMRTLVYNWRVADDVDSLSDHRYIFMTLSATRSALQTRSSAEVPRGRRWALRSLDQDKFLAALESSTWPPINEEQTALEEVEWLRDTLQGACDVAMPRAGARRSSQAYWWTQELAVLRRSSVEAQRRFTRTRRRRRSTAEMIDEAYESYRDARRTLRLAIRQAKNAAWNELLTSVEEDPWGRPYKIVTGRLRPRAPPITESLDPRKASQIVDHLFPPEDGPSITRVIPPPDCTQRDVPPVTGEELQQAVRRIRSGKAPGPDGIPGEAIKLSVKVLGPRVCHIFTRLIKEGIFPPAWRESNLVLIPKPGKPVGEASSYRPICLLDEIGKLFERIVIGRLTQHTARKEHRLDSRQFGFREAKSTIDAISMVRSLAEAETSQGRVLMAVSLDIANAFNTLPWRTIGEAMRHFGLPLYVQEIIGQYLKDRVLSYTNKNRQVVRKEVERGVPQGSVLGPALWNLAYDRILRVSLPPGCSIVCYADDTLVLARGEEWVEARTYAELAVSAIVSAIQRLGLRVAANKTEAIFFHPSRTRPPELSINVCNTPVRVGSFVKYLGLTLDGQWRFNEHHARLAPRVGKMAAALGRLMPNLGGPSWPVRRLYAAAIRSAALYGAPIWAKDLTTRSKMFLRRIERALAVRVGRVYRTTACDAASLIAGVMPLDLEALAHARRYEWVGNIRSRGDQLTPAIKARMKNLSRKEALKSWSERLQQTTADAPGHRVILAVRPCLEDWLDDVAGRLGFRAAQVITGHGAFGDYLCRIGREQSPRCWECGADRDSADHTLAECPAFEEARRELIAVIGVDLSLPVVINAIVEGKGRKSICLLL